MGMGNALFDELDGYEKGVVARALLKGLIKQGYLEENPDLHKPKIVIPIEQFQMKLLSLFADNANASRQRILEELCQIRR